MAKKWWQQITDKIGPKDNELKTDPIGPEEPMLDPNLKENPASPETETPGALGRWMQRRQLTPQLENCIEQLAQNQPLFLSALEKLTASIQAQTEKFQQIDRNNDRTADLIDRQGKVLEQTLAERQRVASTTDRLVGALEAVPKSTRVQAEKLSAIEDQLQSDGQTDRALLDSMEMLGRNVAALTRYAESQKTNREEMINALNRQIQPLVDLAIRRGKLAKANLVLSLVIACILLGILALYARQLFF